MKVLAPLKIDNILDVTDNSIIVLRSPDKYDDGILKMSEIIVHKLRQKYKNIWMILLNNDQSLEAFDEEQMNKLGWVRGKSCSCTVGADGDMGEPGKE